MKNIKCKEKIPLSLNKTKKIKTNLNVLKTEIPNKLKEEIKNNNNILLNEDYAKFFIDFDIKLKPDESKNKENKQKVLMQTLTITNNMNNSHKEKDIPSYIKKIENMVTESANKVEILKKELESILNDEIKQNCTTDINFEFKLLKSELLNVKIKNEFYLLQAKFFENIFYTSRNCIDNYSFKVPNTENENNNTKHDLKAKLNSIFSQNNKYYYENFNTSFTNENKVENNQFKSIVKIENELFSLINTLNMFSLSPIENTITDIWNSVNKMKTKIIRTTKSILSYYILNEDFNKEFKNKIIFFLENEDKFISLESKQRNNHIVKDFADSLTLHVNKVISNKTKNELVDKINNVSMFYENFNIILQTENTNLKNNTNLFYSNSMMKISGITKLIDNYLMFNQDNFKKINEILEIIKSKSIKNIEKVLFSFIKNEENCFIDIIEKFQELNKNYQLIK